MSAETVKPGSVWTRNEKISQVRSHNILAAKAVADVIRTSLGPRGMDKMIQDGKGGVIITNDGATILGELSLAHPTAKMMADLSKAQDIEVGDGTTSVVVLCGSLLERVESLLEQGIHPQVISTSLKLSSIKSEEILEEMSLPIKLDDFDDLVKAATISLHSKAVAQNASLLAPIAVKAVLRVLESPTSTNVDLKNIQIVKKLGGTIEDSELVEGIVFPQATAQRANGPKKVQNAKIGLIQFCLSPPKTDMENSIVIKDYNAMDRLLKEERIIIAKMVKQIASTGCNVLLIQKSILRDAVTDLSLDYLAKHKILVIRDIERTDVEHISKTLGCKPVASLDHFTPDKLGKADLVESVTDSQTTIVKVTGIDTKNTATILLRASNLLMLDETERSLHDALCVVRSLVKKRAIIPGGGAPEIQLSYKLNMWSRSLEGVAQLCVKTFADALQIIPYILASNAGLPPLKIVTELLSKHANGEVHSGINIRKGSIGNMIQENVVQPLLVSTSAIKLATETVLMILKIDDILMTRG